LLVLGQSRLRCRLSLGNSRGAPIIFRWPATPVICLQQFPAPPDGPGLDAGRCCRVKCKIWANFTDGEIHRLLQAQQPRMF
jgi:hypothetical protein